MASISVSQTRTGSLIEAVIEPESVAWHHLHRDFDRPKLLCPQVVQSSATRCTGEQVMSIANIVSISGGKDSTALLLLALALETPNLQAVFADTGHEHPSTYDYVRYLECATGVPIRWVKADFSAEIQRKRDRLLAGELPGWSPEMRDRALEVLRPTGIPYLDLCIWKGRFPSRKGQFCTQFLKRLPIERDVIIPALERFDSVWSWQGVRAQESQARRHLPEFEDLGGFGVYAYRPLIRWTWESVFEAHDYMDIKPNPLYTQGMGRVGCMPCINCNKGELQQVAVRFPDEVARVREWERLVSMASRRGSATFFQIGIDPTASPGDDVSPETHGIDRAVEWSRTSRGGRQLDLLATDGGGCSSSYGLCEGATA